MKAYRSFNRVGRLSDTFRYLKAFVVNTTATRDIESLTDKTLSEMS